MNYDMLVWAAHMAFGIGLWVFLGASLVFFAMSLFWVRRTQAQLLVTTDVHEFTRLEGRCHSVQSLSLSMLLAAIVAVVLIWPSM